MKPLCALMLVIVAGRVAIGCSEAADTAWVEQLPDEVEDAGVDAPAQACAEKAGCPDASTQP